MMVAGAGESNHSEENNKQRKSYRRKRERER